MIFRFLQPKPMPAAREPYHVVPATDCTPAGKPTYSGYHVMHIDAWHSTHRWYWQAARAARRMNQQTNKEAS